MTNYDMVVISSGLEISDEAADMGLSVAVVKDRDSFVKVLAGHHTEKIPGCHIIGIDASNLVQKVANTMRMRLSTDAITQSIYVHPALPEVVQRAFGSLPR